LRFSYYQILLSKFDEKFQKLITAVQIQSTIIQWLLVCGVGVSIGAIVVFITTFPPQWVILTMLACVFVFVILILGNIRKLLLALIVFEIPFQLDINLGYREEVNALGALSGWNFSIASISLRFKLNG